MVFAQYCAKALGGSNPLFSEYKYIMAEIK